MRSFSAGWLFMLAIYMAVSAATTATGREALALVGLACLCGGIAAVQWRSK